MFVKASPLLLAVCIAVTPSVFAEEAASQPQTDNQAQTSTTSESSSKYEATLNKFKQADATLPFFENAYGYAVFPTVGKGIRYRWLVWRRSGLSSRYTRWRFDISAASIGLQLGAQAYSEIIFFESKADYYAFTSGSFEFGAQASAVALTLGASAQAGSTGAGAQAGDKQSKATYINGMAVFTMTKGGLMYEASIGGQGFSFAPNNNYDAE